MNKKKLFRLYKEEGLAVRRRRGRRRATGYAINPRALTMIEGLAGGRSVITPISTLWLAVHLLQVPLFAALGAAVFLLIRAASKVAPRAEKAADSDHCDNYDLEVRFFQPFDERSPSARCDGPPMPRWMAASGGPERRWMGLSPALSCRPSP